MGTGSPRKERRLSLRRLTLWTVAAVSLLLLCASSDSLSYVQRRMLLASAPTGAGLRRGGASTAASQPLIGRVAGDLLQLPSPAGEPFRTATQRCRPPAEGGPPLPQLQRAGAWPGSEPSRGGNTTVITTLHVDRLHLLEAHCAVWPHTIVAAVYAPVSAARRLVCLSEGRGGEELARSSGSLLSWLGLGGSCPYAGWSVDRLKRLLRKVQRRAQKTGQCNLDLSFWTERVGAELGAAAGLLPQAALQNKALLELGPEDASDHSAVVLLDSDMVSVDVWQLVNWPTRWARALREMTAGKALVLPAFQLTPGGVAAAAARGEAAGLAAMRDALDVATAEAGKFPLKQLYAEGRAAVYSDHGFASSQSAALPELWFEAGDMHGDPDDGYPVAPQPGFAPFTMMLQRHVPWADERLRGSFYQRAWQALACRAMGLQHVVQPNSFSLQLPHDGGYSRGEAALKNFLQLEPVLRQLVEEAGRGQYVPVTSFGGTDICKQRDPPAAAAVDVECKLCTPLALLHRRRPAHALKSRMHVSVFAISQPSSQALVTASDAAGHLPRRERERPSAGAPVDQHPPPLELPSAMVKVLFAGDCAGRVEAMFKRVAAVNTSNGPFDMLLCTGGFFSGGADDAEFGGELLPYITGEKQAPIPTYFVGGWGSGSKQALEALSASDSNIKYLGRSGVTTIGGLSVAFLDGTYNAPAFRAPETSATRSPGCRYYSENDVDRFKLALAKAEGDVDILLTCEWPAGTCDGLPDAAKPQDVKKLDGAAVCAEVAMACRPRYHIAAGKHAFYARPPYINKDLGAGSHVTRFIALAGVGVSKQKWLHALGLTPAAQMTPEQLTVIPEGSTPCPYEMASKKRAAQEAEKEEAGLGQQDWRWQQRGAKRQQLAPGERAPIAAPSLGRKDIVKDKSKTAFVSNVAFRATEDDIVDYFSQCGTVVDVVRRTHAQTGRLNAFCHVQFDTEEALQRAIQMNGQSFMGRPLFIDAASSGAAAVARSAKPVEGCWFCLSNPNADVELVASVGEECYVALDKGAITDQHCLVLPVEHYPCSLVAPASTTEEMGRYLSALRTCFAAGGKELVGFERYMALRKSGGNHCHLNAIAVPAAAAAQARAAFERAAERHGFTLSYLPKVSGDAAAKEQLRGAVGDGEHFVALLPDGTRMAHRIAYGERFPLNFGREVLAELAGVPERADWKACAVSKEEEAARCERFKEAFRPYDIMEG